MIDPTDEMIAAAMEAFNSTGAYGPALAAVFAIVERDYKVVPWEIWGRKTDKQQVPDGRGGWKLP